MTDLTAITLQNFRGFKLSSPVEIELGREFIAIVGPNNAGKTSLLRSFYELRPFLNAILEQNQIASLLRDGSYSQGATGVTDSSSLINSGAPNHPAILRLRVLQDSFSARHEDVAVMRSLELQFRASGTALTMTLKYDEELRRVAGEAVSPAVRGGHFYSGAAPLFDFRAIEDIIRLLSSAMYVASFRSPGVGAAVDDLPSGSNFITSWDEWKNGTSRVRQREIQAVLSTLARIFGYNTVDVGVSPDKTQLNVIVNGEPFRVSELGSGFSQFLVTLAGVAITKPTLLLIDEPELHLHPSLQSMFLTTLGSFTARGVVFATHALGLARSNAERVYALSKNTNTGEIHCSILENTPMFSQFLGELSYSSYVAMGFDKVLLVEGPSELKVFRSFLRKLGKDQQVLVLSLGGSDYIKAGNDMELAEIKRISPHVFAIVDSERSAAAQGLPSDRAGFEASCKNVGIDVLVTNKRATENYFPEAAVQRVFGNHVKALGDYDLLAKHVSGWRKADNWRVADSMTQAELMSTEFGPFLKGI
jgi:ABC-type branched-subunit amino acid transport system ATPase component